MTSLSHTLHTPFTGLFNGVNGTGRTLGKKVPLFVSREMMKAIDAMSQGNLEGWLGCLSKFSFRGNFRQNFNGVKQMKLSNKTLMTGLVLAGASLVPDMAHAHDGDLFNEQITSLESLFTGGYMRLGLLGVCGVTAIAGAIKQNGMMFLTGILAGVFAYFMRDWIQATFTAII